MCNNIHRVKKKCLTVINICFALIFGPWLPVVGLFLQNEAHCAEVGGFKSVT